MSGAQYPYELKANDMGEYVQDKDSKIEFDRKRNQETPPNIATTIKSLIKMELQGYRKENERMTKALEEKNQLTVAIIQSLTDLQRQINYGHQKMNTKGSRRNSRKKKVKLDQRKKGFKPSHSQNQQR